MNKDSEGNLDGNF